MAEYRGRAVRAPTGGAPLEQIIDQSNIHGWLQSRITATELRQAALVTTILGTKAEYKAQLTELYRKQGETIARQVEGTPESQEEVYKALNDYLLEGMPCDRVTQVVVNDDKELAWQVTECLHKPYWDQVKGDVQHFYDFREAWVKAFVQGLGPNFTYIKSGNTHRIVRK